MNISDKLNLILTEYSSGNKESAYKKFKKIYLKNNKDLKLRYNLAVMQQELGLLDEAEANYISLIKSNENIKYKINLYNLYISKKLYQKALDLINSIQSKNLSLMQVNQDKAYILYLLKKYDESINQCFQILKIDNKNPSTLNTLGLCFLKLQKYDEANTALLKAFSFDQENIIILNSLGRLNHDLRKSKEADLKDKFFLSFCTFLI